MRSRASRKSTEQSSPVGLAIHKGEPVFLAWLTAVQTGLQKRLEDEELRIIKEGPK